MELNFLVAAVMKIMKKHDHYSVRKRNRKQAWTRVTALTVALCFSLTTIAWSAPELALPNAALRQDVFLPSFVEQIQIPESIGTIEKRYAPKESSSFILHLQDAHGHLEAQENIQAILEFLHDEYDVNLLLIEGGVGKLDPRLLEYFRNSDLNLKVADLLMESGIIGGPEKFLVEQSIESLEGAPDAYGVEDAGLYRENIQAFRKVFAEKEKAERFLEQVKVEIVTASSHLLNDKLKKFFREWMFYQDTPTELLRQ